MVNIFGNKIVQKLVGNFFLAKSFFVNMDVYFRIWPLDAAIMQAKVRLSHKKYSLIRLSVFLKNGLIRRYTPY